MNGNWDRGISQWVQEHTRWPGISWLPITVLNWGIIGNSSWKDLGIVVGIVVGKVVGKNWGIVGNIVGKIAKLESFLRENFFQVKNFPTSRSFQLLFNYRNGSLTFAYVCHFQLNISQSGHTCFCKRKSLEKSRYWKVFKLDKFSGINLLDRSD